MPPVNVNATKQEKHPLQIKFENAILKLLQKKDESEIVNEILPILNSEISINLVYPVTQEQLTKLNRQKLLIILDKLGCSIAEVTLYKWSNNLFNQSRNAYNKFLLLKQYNSLYPTYEHAISISPAFYSHVLDSLVIAIFISVQKIFDNTTGKSSVTIEKLLLKYEQNYTIFREFQEIYKYDEFFEEKISWKWKVSEDEIKFFETNNFSNLRKDGFIDVSPFLVLKLHEWKLNRFKDLKKLDYLDAQRNKIYVHNDKLAMNNFKKLIENNPLSLEDFELFILFSLKFTHFLLLMLTDINFAWEPINNDDWKETLKYTTIGLEKAENDIKKLKEEIKNN